MGGFETYTFRIQGIRMDSKMNLSLNTSHVIRSHSSERRSLNDNEYSNSITSNMK
jgi:hypothetical protein